MKSVPNRVVCSGEIVLEESTHRGSVQQSIDPAVLFGDLEGRLADLNICDGRN